MDAWVGLPIVWTGLVLLTVELKWIDAAEIFTNTWAVQINGGPGQADRIAREHGFINQGNVFGDYYHFRHHAVEKRALSGHKGMNIRLQKEPQVLWAQQQVVKRRKKRDIFEDPTDPDFPKQWYLSNPTHQDLNTKAAWAQGYTGRGVVVTILDDGIEKDHPDLISNYDPEASYDVNDGDADPQPRYTQRNENRHGTRCAGEVAAVANNGICGTGVAYNAKIGGSLMDLVLGTEMSKMSCSFRLHPHKDEYPTSTEKFEHKDETARSQKSRNRRCNNDTTPLSGTVTLPQK